MTGNGKRHYFRASLLFSGLTAVLAIVLAAGLILQCWISLAGQFRLSAEVSPGAVLLVTSSSQPNDQYRLFQTGLAVAGLASDTWQLPDQKSGTNSSVSGQLQTAIASLANDSRCEPTRVWLAAADDVAAAAFDNACQLKIFAGLLLFVPQDLNQLTTAKIQQWPASRPLAVFTGLTAANSQGQADRQFFETLTSEDTTLFPAYQAGSSLPLQYTSANGSIWLGLYPALDPNWALTSPRVLTDATGWLASWSEDAQSAGQYQTAARLMSELPFKILLAGLLLLAALSSLNLFLLRLPLDQSRLMPQDSARQTRSFHGWAEVIIWLPSIALALGVGWLTNWISAGQLDATLLTLAVLPGCHGWIWLFINQVRDMSKRKTQVRAGDSPAGYRPIHLPVSLRRLPGLILPLGFLIMAGFWSDMIFRTFSASARQMTLLALLVFIGWPAGMAGTCGQIGNNISAGVRTNPGVGQTIWQHLPFLVLPVLAGLKLGWTGLAASLLLLTIHFWSTGLGKASTIITHRPAIGSLIQSTAYAIGILMPPVLLGLRGLFH